MHDVNKLSPASTWTPREVCLAYRSGHLLAEVAGMALFIYIDLMMRPCEADAQKDNMRSSPSSPWETLGLFVAVLPLDGAMIRQDGRNSVRKSPTYYY